MMLELTPSISSSQAMQEQPGKLLDQPLTSIQTHALPTLICVQQQLTLQFNQ